MMDEIDIFKTIFVIEFGAVMFCLGIIVGVLLN